MLMTIIGYNKGVRVVCNVVAIRLHCSIRKYRGAASPVKISCDSVICQNAKNLKCNDQEFRFTAHIVIALLEFARDTIYLTFSPLILRCKRKDKIAQSKLDTSSASDAHKFCAKFHVEPLNCSDSHWRSEVAVAVIYLLKIAQRHNMPPLGSVGALKHVAARYSNTTTGSLQRCQMT